MSRNAADAARQSDPAENRQFRRRWTGPTDDRAAGTYDGRPSNDEALDRIARAMADDWRAMRRERAA
jgi:hypothetical protein